MNISLNIPSGDGDTLHSDITEHREIMTRSGFAVIGPAILIPEPGTDYPGSYQVWNPYVDDDGDYGWVYITPDGVAVVTDYLPRAEDMEGSE